MSGSPQPVLRPVLQADGAKHGGDEAVGRLVHPAPDRGYGHGWHREWKEKDDPEKALELQAAIEDHREQESEATRRQQIEGKPGNVVCDSVLEAGLGKQRE